MHAALIFMVALVGTSSASVASADLPAPMLGLSSCLAMTDDHQRLGCLDTEAAKLVAAVKHHDVTVLGRKDMQETRRGLFGYALPKMSLFGSVGSDNAKDDVAEIDAVVQTVAPLGYGKWRMKLEGDAVWDTTEEVNWDPPHVGSHVHIKRGSFGSYYMSIDHASPVRAMRAR